MLQLVLDLDGLDPQVPVTYLRAHAPRPTASTTTRQDTKLRRRPALSRITT